MCIQWLKCLRTQHDYWQIAFLQPKFVKVGLGGTLQERLHTTKWQHLCKMIDGSCLLQARGVVIWSLIYISLFARWQHTTNNNIKHTSTNTSTDWEKEKQIWHRIFTRISIWWALPSWWALPPWLGPTLKMEFSHLIYSTLTTVCILIQMLLYATFSNTSAPKIRKAVTY